MSETSRLCLSTWKGDVYHGNYSKLVEEVYLIADLFYKEKNPDWLKTFKLLIKELDDLSDRMIMAHIRKYLKEFLKAAAKAVKGEYNRRQLKKEREKTLYLLSKAYCS